ncbi:acetyltransferase [Peribacillus simplex]|uniref:Acetyltransferase n=1 Tax=Peribacillus simplex TaxID=1478 RepID=A0A8B5XTF7_9BACI|nr:acetyltransferase [Peribacillus simplex]MED3985149.1 acetyltransferase [Peribacillus simplex]MED4093259.1 acetyltransferase [Peribacillus simplex]TVX77688.1 acetyltransferase [Peribacillus simplex]CAH0143358.1 Putative acetyltransferase EpsM [Peribacillus simplex]
MKKIVIIGAGGHSKVVQDIVEAMGEYRLMAILDDQYEVLKRKGNVYFGPILSYRSLFIHFECKVIIAIGRNDLRLKIVNELNLDVMDYGTVIHPTAIVGKNVSIGKGTVIMPNVVLNAGARVGNHVIVNTSSVIEHDTHLDDFIHIAPSATLTGAVKVGTGTLIGAGSTVIPSITIGEWCKVGAGSTVIKDIPNASTAVGSPARIIK